MGLLFTTNGMTDNDIINYYYGEAVKEITAEVLSMKNIHLWYNHVIQLPEKEKNTYLIAILDDQVSNGGFNQYFVNSYGQFAVETVRALQIIKADTTAKITELAYEAVNSAEYNTAAFIEALRLGHIEELYETDALDEYLEELDDKYYEYHDNLGQLLGDYLRKQCIDNHHA